MSKKVKKFSSLLTFLVAGFGLVAGLVSINHAKAPVAVHADEVAYYLAGTMNGWNTKDDAYQLDKIGDTTFKYEGPIDDGSKDIKFKITNGTWDVSYGYNNLDENSKSYFSGEGEDIKIPAKSNGVIINLDTSKEDNEKISAYFIPDELDNIVKASTEGINLNRMRVWLDRGIFEVDGALNALQFGTAGTAEESTIYEASGYRRLFGEPDGPNQHWLAYFDIPLNALTTGMEIRVVRLDRFRTEIWNTTEFHTWTDGDNNKVLYVGNNWNNTTLTPGIIDDEKEIPVGFLKDVLEGYLTCSPSAINGYNAFPEMSRTFFKKADGDWKIVGLLNEVLLDDYVSMDTTYVGGRVINNVDAYEKYLRMEALYTVGTGGVDAPYINYSNSNPIQLVMLIGVIGLSSLAAFYFLKKKKVA